MRHARHLIVLVFPLVLSACASSSMPEFLQVYQMDINQGNILSEEKVAKLKAGGAKKASDEKKEKQD